MLFSLPTLTSITPAIYHDLSDRDLKDQFIVRAVLPICSRFSCLTLAVCRKKMPTIVTGTKSHDTNRLCRFIRRTTHLLRWNWCDRCPTTAWRSEERRVGKECRSRW